MSGVDIEKLKAGAIPMPTNENIDALAALWVANPDMDAIFEPLFSFYDMPSFKQLYRLFLKRDTFPRQELQAIVDSISDPILLVDLIRFFGESVVQNPRSIAFVSHLKQKGLVPKP